MLPQLMRMAFEAIKSLNEMEGHRIGPGRRSALNRKRSIVPYAGFLKPWGERTKGYAAHGNGKRKES